MKHISILCALFMVVGCVRQSEKHIDTPQGNFAHTVYFWLVNPDNSDDRQAFEQHLTTFINSSAYVETKHIGTPAATGHRDVVDASYTYSLLLTFKDKQAQDKYQEEEVHKQFIKDASHLWKKVVVYDSEDILK